MACCVGKEKSGRKSGSFTLSAAVAIKYEKKKRMVVIRMIIECQQHNDSPSPAPRQWRPVSNPNVRAESVCMALFRCFHLRRADAVETLRIICPLRIAEINQAIGERAALQ